MPGLLDFLGLQSGGGGLLGLGGNPLTDASAAIREWLAGSG
jgi:hypothetical protein